MNHTQGAWPKEVKTSEMQDKERYLRRVENLKEYHQSVRRLSRIVQRPIEQNNTIDLYEEYFSEMEDTHASEPPSARTVCVFRDPNETKRSASKICWHPDGNAKVAVSYSVMQFQQMPENMPRSSYIWDVNSPNEPDQEILPQSPLCSLVYNPRSTDHMVGGSYNGQISFWDLRKGSAPVDSSRIEQSHRDPVHDIFWIQSRTGNECVSASTDGQMLWWDVRKLAAGPTDSMTLRASEGEQVHGATAMSYRSDAGATRYLVATEGGLTALVDRKAKKDAESTKAIKTMYGTEAGAHHGPVYSIERHPYAPKYFATVGDWSMRLWMEDLKTPILTTRYDSSYLTAGRWSPTRPGVFFTTKMDGTLDAWDFNHKHNEPTFSTKVADCALTSLGVHNDGRLLAVGSVDGSTTVMQISGALASQQANEKQGIISMLERETKREKALELRANARRKEEAQSKRRNQNEDEGKVLEEKERSDDALRDAESDFFRIIDMTSDETPAARAQRDEAVEGAPVGGEAQQQGEAPSAPEGQQQSAD